MKRFIWVFFLFYITIFITSFFFNVALELTGSGLVHIVSLVMPPLLFLFFSWWYFRKARNEWKDRVIIGIVWIVLALGISAPLSQLVYGISWTYVLNVNILKGQAINFVAVLIAGYVAYDAPTSTSSRST